MAEALGAALGQARRLAERDALEQALAEALSGTSQGRQVCALLFVAVSDVERINRSLGVDAGDEYLQEFSRRLIAYGGDGMQCFHVVGCQFAALLPATDYDAGTLGRVEGAAHALVDACTAPVHVAGEALPVNLTVGVALGPDDAREPRELLACAQAACVQARAAGNVPVHFYTARTGRDSGDSLQLLGEINGAIGSGQFVPHYQPIVDATNNRLAGAEALVRWIHPERGFQSPADFIPLAERNGLISAIGFEVFDQVCQDLATWLAAGLAVPWVSVNVSAHQLLQPGLVDEFARRVAACRLNAGMIELEITESAMMLQPERSAHVLGNLRRRGFRIVVDDFGTGYSSLAYLRRFPVDKIKMDMSYVQRINIDKTDRAIVAATVGLAKELNLEVVAEGVETPPQMLSLRDMGCPLVQGYLVSRPVPRDEFAAWARPLLG